MSKPRQSHSRSMTGGQDLWFEPKLHLLICKIHGYGVHPTPQAITRHLRGEGHHCRGKTLKSTVAALMSLPLRSLDELFEQVPPVEAQPISPSIRNLKVLAGWTCLACNGWYLTTSIELVQRHAATKHGRRRGEASLWTSCQIQTFFQETKDRRYFRVADSQRATAHILHKTGRSEAEMRSQPTRANIRPGGNVNVCSSSSRYLTTPRVALSFVHPFAHIANRHMSGFPIAYLDGLFKSASFKAASEPLFDPSHVDSENGMQKVFPECDDAPLFYHALIYSMVRSSSGETSVESVALERRIVDLLNCQQGSQSEVSQATLGAIMLLKTTAYKLEDSLAHAIHSQGLQAALTSCGSRKLTSSARRAYFWQEVYAAVFLDCHLAVESVEIYEDARWVREIPSDNAMQDLPVGFLRHASLLPSTLLDVVIDLLEMKSYIPILAQLPRHMRYQHLDSMQASIESRLVRLAKDCKAAGAITEGVRLATFLCCYCAWMEIWNDHFIPCKLAEKLLDVLERTVTTDERFASNWREYLDLLLWLALVCCNVIELDDGRIGQLKSRRKRLLNAIERMLCTQDTPNAVHALDSAVMDFVYCEWWMTNEKQVREWQKLKASIVDNADV